MNTLWFSKAYEICLQRFVGRVLTSVFSDCQGIILIDFIDNGRTVTSHYNPTLLSPRKNCEEKTPKVAQRWFAFAGQYSCTQIACCYANNSRFRVQMFRTPPLFIRSGSVRLSSTEKKSSRGDRSYESPVFRIRQNLFF